MSLLHDGARNGARNGARTALAPCLETWLALWLAPWLAPGGIVLTCYDMMAAAIVYMLMRLQLEALRGW